MMIAGSPFALAPMAEITTPAFRKIVREFSADTVMFSEMLSAAAIVSGAAGNRARAEKYEFDDPFVFQILGNSDRIMAESCKILSETGCMGIDINMGCSAPDILKKNMGAKLLNDPDAAAKIVRACRGAVGCMLSVKMRSGFLENDTAKLRDFVKMLEGEGVDLITLHPRYARISFKRSADWKLVKFVKENVNIPVYGNGDITEAETAIARLRQTGCDGIMIGRGAVKSPWIFKICRDVYNGIHGGLHLKLDEIFYRALGYISEYLPDHLHKSRGHRFCFYYCKNFQFSHEFFKMIRRADTITEMTDVVKGYFNRNPSGKERTIDF